MTLVVTSITYDPYDFYLQLSDSKNRNSDVAKKGANGTENKIKKKGTSLNVIGLMVVLDNEPEIKSRLW